MPILTERGRWSSATLDERGRRVFTNLTEQGQSVFGNTIATQSYYLSMDGVDDYVQTPSITFDKVQIDAFLDYPNAIGATTDSRGLFDARSGLANGYIWHKANFNIDEWGSGISSVTVDGEVATNNTRFLKTGIRSTTVINTSAVCTDDVKLFSLYNSTAGMKAKVYNVKFYNGAILVAHYDMTQGDLLTGKVYDISGNGNHATNSGGTWIAEQSDAGVDVSYNFSSKQVIHEDITYLESIRQIIYVDRTSDFSTTQTIGTQPIYYLQMDGVDDRLQLPSLTATKIVIDGWINSTQDNSRDVVFDARNGYNGLLDAGYTTGFKIYSNDVSVSSYTSLPKDQRYTLRLHHGTEGTAFTDDFTVYARYDGATSLSGRIWDVKIYNGATLVAHYDMSTQTVNDQSGNGNHATLTGGTFVQENGDTGVDVSTNYTSKQVIYSDIPTLFSSNQKLYVDRIVENYTKQIQYSNRTSDFSDKQIIYADKINILSSKQIVFANRSTPYSSKQSVYKSDIFDIANRQNIYANRTDNFTSKQMLHTTRTYSYATVQVLFSDYIVFTANYPLKSVIFRDFSEINPSKQAWYTSRNYAMSSSQKMYISELSNLSTRVIIRRDISIANSTKQSIHKQTSEAISSKQMMNVDRTELASITNKIYKTLNVNNSVKQIITKDFQIIYPANQFVFRNTMSENSVHSKIWKNESLDGLTNQIIYRNYSEDNLTKPIIFADIVSDSLLKVIIFDAEKLIVDTIEIKGHRSLILDINGHRELELYITGSLKKVNS